MTIMQELPLVRGKYRENADLAKMCWFATGGVAEVLYIPADIDDLVYFLHNKPPKIPLFVLGVGSNLLIRDGGINGVVIRLGREFNYVKISDNKVKAGAATLDLFVAEAASNSCISGLEFLSGIPGTIGGALAMNAGAYGSDIANSLESAVAVSMTGEKIILKTKDFGYTYRSNALTEKYIFVEATFSGSLANRDDIQKKMHYIKEQRNLTQPIKSRTGGSTFKNPPNSNYKAWQLIDLAGCRGLAIGGASVSQLHCNFLLNDGNATADDLEKLMTEVQKRVLAKFGIMLEKEIIIAGNPVTQQSENRSMQSAALSNQSQDLSEQNRKRLLYQSTHRGCKEMDIILGDFASKNLDRLPNDLLDGYNEILQLNDALIYDLVIEKLSCDATLSLSKKAQRVLQMLISNYKI